MNRYTYVVIAFIRVNIHTQYITSNLNTKKQESPLIEILTSDLLIEKLEFIISEKGYYIEHILEILRMLNLFYSTNKGLIFNQALFDQTYSEYKTLEPEINIALLVRNINEFKEDKNILITLTTIRALLSIIGEYESLPQNPLMLK